MLPVLPPIGALPSAGATRLRELSVLGADPTGTSADGTLLRSGRVLTPSAGLTVPGAVLSGETPTCLPVRCAPALGAVLLEPMFRYPH